jgi:peptide/nickel transport system substrate-binding protein
VENQLDPDARLPTWHRIQQLYATELPVLPLFFRSNPYVLPRWLEGLEPTGNLTSSAQWVENWKRVE